MQSKLIVKKFLSALAASRTAKSNVIINLSVDPSLDVDVPHTQVEGFDCLVREKVYDFIVADLPLGMRHEKIDFRGSTINVRSNWVDLQKALRLLTPNGLCAALLEPSAFGISEGSKFQEALADEGFYLNGVFNTPADLLSSTRIRPVIVVFTRIKRFSLFVAELQDESQAITVARAFAQGEAGDSLRDGMSLQYGVFDGFESLKARLQIERLETQYKDYKSYSLGEIAVEMNLVRSGESLQHKENSVYVPTIGNTNVVNDLSLVSIKHHNLIQIVFSDIVKSDYVAAFFRSDLGLLVLRSVMRGTIPKITKSGLSKAKIAVPSPAEQGEISRSQNRLQALKEAISDFQNELALNPRNASEVRGKVEDMLDTIGELTEADRVMNFAREGESATVEFKESFSLDVKKQTREKYIELSSLKTIAAFLNTEGGVLLVGVSDDGSIPGLNREIEKFHKGDLDKFLLHFKNLLKTRIGEEFYTYIEYKLVRVNGNHVLSLECQKSKIPCYLDNAEFYVRTNPATDKLEGPKLVQYVTNHFG